MTPQDIEKYGVLGAFGVALLTMLLTIGIPKLFKWLETRGEIVNERERQRIIEEKTDTDTDAAMIKTVTDTITDQRAELRAVRKELGESNDLRDEYHINWQNTLTLLDERNAQLETALQRIREKNTQIENLQAKLDYCLDNNRNALDNFLDDGTQPIEK